ncbi:hypothetical protein I6F37_38065, partial [Bradyrhizobium sp. NBAIM08]|nr:hypothetical protein [Bradyrhizobium sp. NBAIM08]
VMASQFNRALQQADRQRVTLGSTGVTTTDLRQWLQRQAGAGELHALLGEALSTGVQPVIVAAQELVDGAEAEFGRDRPKPADVAGLPAAQAAPDGRLEVLSLPAELGALQALLNGWTTEGRGVQPVAPRDGAKLTYDVVGPICESGDWLARERELAVEPGDLLAIMTAGAYGMTMASNYNTRGRAAEVIVDGEQLHLVRQRENPADLFALESMLK